MELRIKTGIFIVGCICAALTAFYLSDWIQFTGQSYRMKQRPPQFALKISSTTTGSCKCLCIDSSYLQSRSYPGKNGKAISNRAIYVRLIGRMGNSLFQLASAYAMAKYVNSQLIVVQNSVLSNLDQKHFKTINKRDWNRLKVKTIVGAHELSVYISALKTALTASLKFQHSLQRYSYFSGCEDEIRYKLQLRIDIIAKADGAIDKLIAEYRNLSRGHSRSKGEVRTVGIHVRRGDLISEHYHRDGYRNPNVLYYENAMSYFRHKYPNVVFIVASNGQDWVKQNLLQPGVYLSPLKTAAEDMALISRCDHAITSLGTFSWWAGFYNRGTVIYYKNWVAPNSALWKRTEYKESERFPSYWIPMS